ncbi:MAG TPA: HAMP domain-containing sensor histidine kinase [Kofleriaceae bacterium]|nr:HAMP domain-containing sensor histidine kinase [Kofleriaceae bacterium]
MASYLEGRAHVGGSSPSDSELEGLRRRIAELERALALRDEVIATLGHELRNPLSPVYLQLGHLLDTLEAGESPPDREWLIAKLGGLQTRFARFLASLDRLLDASRPGGTLSLELERVDLGQLVHEVCAGMQSQVEAARSELVISVAGPVFGVWDRLRVQQIVWNLLSNAVRYGAGAPIHVQVEAQAHRASLVVKDHGMGIAREDLARIFEAYERGAAGRKSAGGFGLGLWIVRRLTAAMGGTIAVESRPGEGATFTVTLPAVPELGKAD